MNLHVPELLKELLNDILGFSQEIDMSDGSIVQLQSHNGKWLIFQPTIILRTVKKKTHDGSYSYEIRMTRDGVLEIVDKFSNVSDAFIKHKLLSAKLGLK